MVRSMRRDVVPCSRLYVLFYGFVVTVRRRWHDKAWTQWDYDRSWGYYDRGWNCGDEIGYVEIDTVCSGVD